jgi:hypothetical protein
MKAKMILVKKKTLLLLVMILSLKNLKIKKNHLKTLNKK